MFVIAIVPSELKISTDERSTNMQNSISSPSLLKGADMLGTENRLLKETAPVEDVRLATIFPAAGLTATSKYSPTEFSSLNDEDSLRLTLNLAS